MEGFRCAGELQYIHFLPVGCMLYTESMRKKVRDRAKDGKRERERRIRISNSKDK